jgi:signal transduction histidine kinase
MSPFSSIEMHRAEHRFALAVVGAFLAGGLAWVLLTDLVLYAITRDPVQVARFETAKGWIFVFVAALLLYPVLRRSASRLTRAQATLSAVIECIADGVLLLGADRTILHANPAALRALRCEKPEDLIGMDADEFSRRFRLSHPDGSLVPPNQFVSQRAFEEGGPIRHKAILHPPGGDEIIIASTAAAVRCGVDAPAEIVVSVWHDITETERLEDLRNQFFAAAAHSLKTPLAIIKASAQMLLSGGLAPRPARSAAAIERQSQQVDRLVENLLVLARIRSGTLQLHPAEMELGSLVEDAAHEMSRTTREHEVYAEVLATPRVHGDQERLAMVLRNMIDGACRSSAAGTPIVVRLAQHGRDAEIGVRYELHPEEEASDAYREYDDMGVSRYVTSAVVKAHGGALREETVGREKTAWVRLPAIEGRHGPA